MLSHMDPYIGIVIFELEAGPMVAQPSFFREDFYIVYADTQEEADRIASESCDCENEAKWHRMMEENVEMLCGEQSRNLNFIPLDDTSLRYVKTTCELIHAGFISNAKFSAANSEIKINGVLGKVDIKRTKKQTNQMTI